MRALRLSAMLLMLALSTTIAHAHAQLERASPRVGSTGDYRPFTYRDPVSQEFSGSDVDMALNP